MPAIIPGRAERLVGRNTKGRPLPSGPSILSMPATALNLVFDIEIEVRVIVHLALRLEFFR